jgi:hypothetical protein
MVIISFLLSFAMALVVSILLSTILGVVYFFVAATIVDKFNLNRGNLGFHFLNGALFATIVSFFLLLAFLMRIQ